MLPRQRGSILFTARTASLRGGKGYAAIRERQGGAARGGGEHGGEPAARSTSRTWYIDAVVDTASCASASARRTGGGVAALAPDALMQPASVADA